MAAAGVVPAVIDDEADSDCDAIHAGALKATMAKAEGKLKKSKPINFVAKSAMVFSAHRVGSGERQPLDQDELYSLHQKFDAEEKFLDGDKLVLVGFVSCI
jgi:hypothetical protein